MNCVVVENEVNLPSPFPTSRAYCPKITPVVSSQAYQLKLAFAVMLNLSIGLTVLKNVVVRTQE
jgi:hypothetical protein